MGRADILAGRQKIFRFDGDQCTQRNLKRNRREVDVIVSFAAGMQIDMIIPDANTVFKSNRPALAFG